jgi:RNA-directed DNA polymerase
MLERAKSGCYRAPAVKRVYIRNGEQRGLGIPTFEEKVLQRAIAMVLEPVYEAMFLNGSYGFRPGRSARQAIDTLNSATVEMRGAWVIELEATSRSERVGGRWHAHFDRAP